MWLSTTADRMAWPPSCHVTGSEHAWLNARVRGCSRLRLEGAFVIIMFDNVAKHKRAVTEVSADVSGRDHRQCSWRLSPRGMARLNWPGWLIKYQGGASANRTGEPVTHTSTNRCQRIVTASIDTQRLIVHCAKSPTRTLPRRTESDSVRKNRSPNRLHKTSRWMLQWSSTFRRVWCNIFWRIIFVAPYCGVLTDCKSLGMRGIKNCPTIPQRHRNTAIPVYRDISWRHRLWTTFYQ